MWRIIKNGRTRGRHSVRSIDWTQIPLGNEIVWVGCNSWFECLTKFAGVESKNAEAVEIVGFEDPVGSEVVGDFLSVPRYWLAVFVAPLSDRFIRRLVIIDDAIVFGCSDIWDIEP